MKAVVAAFNQEKALVGAFSVVTNLWMELFQALTRRVYPVYPCLDIGLHQPHWPHTGRGHGARSVGLQCPNPGSAHDAVCTVLSSRQRPDHGYCYDSFIAMCGQGRNKLSTAVALCLQIYDDKVVVDQAI